MAAGGAGRQGQAAWRGGRHLLEVDAVEAQAQAAGEEPRATDACRDGVGGEEDVPLGEQLRFTSTCWKAEGLYGSPPSIVKIGEKLVHPHLSRLGALSKIKTTQN